MPAGPDQITELLGRVERGEPDAYEKLLPLVYDALRQQASIVMRREPPDHTLQPTALVHEAFLRLVGQQNARWESRGQFMAVCATVMRRILIDEARTRKRRKRGGDWGRIALVDSVLEHRDGRVELMELDESLRRLGEIDRRKERVVELRFFGGLSHEQTAGLLGLSLATVRRDWEFARAWLLAELSGDGRPHT